MPVAGNPQLNIRLEPGLMQKLKEAAQAQGLNPQEFARNLIKRELGEPVAVPVSVYQGELESAISLLRGEVRTELDALRLEVAELKKLEPVAA